jgi:hypothetical protein
MEALNPLFAMVPIANAFYDNPKLPSGDSALERWVNHAILTYGDHELLIESTISKRKKESDDVDGDSSDSASTGSGGSFPDIKLKHPRYNRIFIEVKGSFTKSPIQFNSTPPAGVHSDGSEEVRCFYVIAHLKRTPRQIVRIGLVDGYYFDTNAHLVEDVREFIRNAIDREIGRSKNGWHLKVPKIEGKVIDPYIQRINSFNDENYSARIRRMYHAPNPLETFSNYKCFSVLQRDHYQKYMLKDGNVSFAGVLLRKEASTLREDKRNNQNYFFDIYESLNTEGQTRLYD